MSVYEMMMSGQLDIETVDDTNTHTNDTAGYCGVFFVEDSEVNTATLGRNATGSIDGWSFVAGSILPTRIASFKLTSGKAILVKGAGRP